MNLGIYVYKYLRKFQLKRVQLKLPYFLQVRRHQFSMFWESELDIIFFIVEPNNNEHDYNAGNENTYRIFLKNNQIKI